MDRELREDLFQVYIDIDTDPKELVIWLNDNGALVYDAHKTGLVDERWFAREGLDIADFHAGIIQGGILLDEYISGAAFIRRRHCHKCRSSSVVAGSPFGVAGGP